MYFYLSNAVTNASLTFRRGSAMVHIYVFPEMHVKHSLVVTSCTLMSRRYICCIWTNMKQMPQLMAQLNTALSVAFQATKKLFARQTE